MLQAEWLSVLMENSWNEIYLVDLDTLRLLYMNRAARINLQYQDDELGDLTLSKLVNPDAVEPVSQAFRALSTNRNIGRSLETVHVRKDGTRYPVQFQVFQYTHTLLTAAVVIGSDLSPASAAKTSLDEARVHSIASNTPGLVYQFLLRENGSVAFTYLSKGCYPLLGIKAAQLRADPSLLLSIIQPEDRQSYLDAMAASARDMSSWNWEGRIWIESWKDIKWINLRCTPQAIAGGGVQWDGVMTNITQGKLAESEIRRSRMQLAELTTHVEMVKEQERTRIAREIHDDLGGNLTAIKMALARLADGLPETDAPLLKKAEYLDALVDRTIEAAHRISRDLRPGVLDLGIVAALAWQAGEFENRLGIPCEFASDQEEFDLSSEQATGLFRIFQETLTNISKHAGATRVTVRLAQIDDGISLEIVDNGRGIAETDYLKSKSFGIRGMVERANALGGKLTIKTPEGGGCAVAIRIPYEIWQI